jgi:polyisoprenoid-binding protein YceI
MDAWLQIFTFKEGLLSKLAHDLRISATRFHATVRGNQLSVRVDLTSLKIDGIVRGGRVEKSELSPSDRDKIHEIMAKDVLGTRDHPEARFNGRIVGDVSPFRIEGQLTLHGESAPFSIVLTLRDQRLVGEAELVPSQWGIKPYRALGGTLKVQDRVRVHVDASAEWMERGTELNPAIELVWSARASRSSLRPS